MPGPKTFRCQLITPEAALLDAQTSLAVFTAHDGEMGVMLNRAPLLCKLGIGQLRIKTDKRTDTYFIDGGFAQVLDNDVTVLTPSAIAAENIDSAEAEKELAAARGRKASGTADLQARAQDIQRASAKLKIAARR